jgi:hypothetical protein
VQLKVYKHSGTCFNGHAEGYGLFKRALERKESVLDSLIMSPIFKIVFRGRAALVTGDTGFIGSWLATWLLNLGADVIGYSLRWKTAKDRIVLCG